jgi:hypothetical protein
MPTLSEISSSHGCKHGATSQKTAICMIKLVPLLCYNQRIYAAERNKKNKENPLISLWKALRSTAFPTRVLMDCWKYKFIKQSVILVATSFVYSPR